MRTSNLYFFFCCIASFVGRWTSSVWLGTASLASVAEGGADGGVTLPRRCHLVLTTGGGGVGPCLGLSRRRSVRLAVPPFTLGSCPPLEAHGSLTPLLVSPGVCGARLPALPPSSHPLVLPRACCGRPSRPPCGPLGAATPRRVPSLPPPRACRRRLRGGATLTRTTRTDRDTRARAPAAVADAPTARRPSHRHLGGRPTRPCAAWPERRVGFPLAVPRAWGSFFFFLLS